MVVCSRVPKPLIAALLVLRTAHGWEVRQSLAPTQPRSILIVRHAEADGAPPTLPLTPAGRQRADLVVQTLRGVPCTHRFTSHTTRTRPMVEGLAAAPGGPIGQVPGPGSLLAGPPGTDQPSRRASLEPLSTAWRHLPPGRVARVAWHSENRLALLHRLGGPRAPAGPSCVRGSLGVPGTENRCSPRSEDAHLWHLVRGAGRAEPLALVDLRYGAGWRAPGREAGGPCSQTERTADPGPGADLQPPALMPRSDS